MQSETCGGIAIFSFVRVAVLGSFILVLAMTSGTVGAEEISHDEGSQPALENPIWTSTPTRVDRSRDARERLPPRPVVGIGRRSVRVDVFPGLDGDAGFRASGRRLRLAGIDLPPRDRTCPYQNGRRWPCGVRAWAWTSGLIAGKRLMCDTPEKWDEPGSTVECYLLDRSVSEMVLSAGWAEPSTDAPPHLVAAHSRAVEARIGLFSLFPPP